MTLLDYRFPSDIALGMVGGPEFNTHITETPAGHEQREITRPLPRARYVLATSLMRVEHLASLRQLFYVAKGRAYGFKFQDPFDHDATNEILGKGDGETCIFPLIKSYRLSPTDCFIRKIKYPVVESLRVFKQNLPTAEWRLTKQGEISFAKPPAVGEQLTASFTFDLPVRFDMDFLAQKIDAPQTAFIDNIHLIEIL